MDESEAEKTPNTKRVLIAGSILLLGLVLIISHVTAEALGARMERQIRVGQTELEGLVQGFSNQVSALVLGTKPRPAELVEVVRAYFVEPPEPGHERHLFKWMEDHDVSMSDLRHEKVQQLITEGRSSYQEQRRTLRDIERRYFHSLDSIYTGFWLRRNGYPQINLKR